MFWLSRHLSSVTDFHSTSFLCRCELCQLNFRRSHHLKVHLASNNHCSAEEDLRERAMPLPNQMVTVNKAGTKVVRTADRVNDFRDVELGRESDDGQQEVLMVDVSGLETTIVLEQDESSLDRLTPTGNKI